MRCQGSRQRCSSALWLSLPLRLALVACLPWACSAERLECEDLKPFRARECGGTEYFVDGESYFRSVYDEVEALTGDHEVIIAGWKMEPELFYFLGEGRPESRMDEWIGRAAKRGIRIYLQFWYGQMNKLKKGFFKTMKVSSRIKQLVGMHRNIHAFADSGRGSTMTILWTTHIKAIVIDGRVAYAGGFDMSTWRWDTLQHLRPTPQRAGGEGSWIDAAVRISGLAAWDLRTALTTRHTSYCSSWANSLQRNLFMTKFKGYDFCNASEIPSDAIGRCGKDAACNSQNKPTECIRGQCFCAQDSAPLFSKELGRRECEEVVTHGPLGTMGSCRVLLTASTYRMDVKKHRADILEAYLDSIKKAELFVIIDNQYFVSSRGEKSGPVNQVMSALVQKLGDKISRNEEFSVVLFLAGKTSDSHQPTMQTLFSDLEPGGGLLPRLIATLKNLGIKAPNAWRKYVAIAWAGKAVTRPYLRKTLGETRWGEVLASESHSKEVPPDGQASVYSIFIHSKVLIVDGAVAQVGSANVNDRSLKQGSESDAELNVEVWGPGVKELFDKVVHQYTGQMLPPDGRLASRINSIADRNNERMKSWVGMNFATGLWEDSQQRLFVNPTESAAFVDMMAGGSPMFLRANGTRPNFEGFIFPWTRELWGDPEAAYWKSTLAKLIPKVTY